MSDLPTPVAYERTFDALYGLVVDEQRDDLVRAHVDIQDHHKQPMGLVHGGLLASIAEAITSMGTARVVIHDGEMAQGLSNQTNFLRPVFGSVIRATATRRHRGRTTWVWEVDITDEQDRLCAIIRMTIAVRPMPPEVAARVRETHGDPA
ncbi:hotdog fold thioesterase [Conexibacter sp. W3-3-2]|uniref:PaaI family thioesterase n=1 Tax=Conexibacter sp. W3-3-2 TaxID=2675227 RepID=UPI0012B85D06|nr:PaaI family thioesterase [Conexibacter sp. W3-3-2]MTD43298.1 hotdog fold thioesterase [Conexibacter sp. W3-3-2]